jgi:hypothetical protein
MTCGELTASAKPSVLLGSASLGVLGTTPSSFNTITLSFPVMWIRIQWGPWIRIRFCNLDPDPEGQK